MMFIAGLFLSMGVALAQTQVNGTVTSAAHPSVWKAQRQVP